MAPLMNGIRCLVFVFPRPVLYRVLCTFSPALVALAGPSWLAAIFSNRRPHRSNPFLILRYPSNPPPPLTRFLLLLNQNKKGANPSSA
ncbi:hypothetical protein LZ30DRAFT_735490 [Colletotrichum cereale]|nr:hypothetical protein LZ30DRAFT_735490 [Colletotrichum cereale]